MQGLGGGRVGAASRPSREGPSIQAAEQGQPRGLAPGGGKGALGQRAFPLAAQCRPPAGGWRGHWGERRPSSGRAVGTGRRIGEPASRLVFLSPVKRWVPAPLVGGAASRPINQRAQCLEQLVNRQDRVYVAPAEGCLEFFLPPGWAAGSGVPGSDSQLPGDVTQKKPRLLAGCDLHRRVSLLPTKQLLTSRGGGVLTSHPVVTHPLITTPTPGSSRPAGEAFTGELVKHHYPRIVKRSFKLCFNITGFLVILGISL